MVTTYITYGSNSANIEKWIKKHNLVTTEKSVKRLAAASDSHTALQAAANPSPTLAAKSPQIICKTVTCKLRRNCLEKMTDELKKYLLGSCRNWMLPEEIKAITRFSFTESGLEKAKKNALADYKLERFYGFNDEKTNNLVALGKDEFENTIALRILTDNPTILNNCSNCGKLARTPRARQCRHCGHKWFDKIKK